MACLRKLDVLHVHAGWCALVFVADAPHAVFDVLLVQISERVARGKIYLPAFSPSDGLSPTSSPDETRRDTGQVIICAAATACIGKMSKRDTASAVRDMQDVSQLPCVSLGVGI